jgi:hypothetical protein
MLKKFIIFCLLSMTSVGHANSVSLYQIDLIVFTHQNSQAEENGVSAVASNMHHAIPLQGSTEAMTPYHLLPASFSHLRNEYWALNRKPNYQVLFHYTWLQPSNNQRAIALPANSQHGWNVEGTLRVRQSNYYLLDTDLVFSTSGNQQTAFTFSQKQRLKPGTVYYLDHPQAGMLIKVQKVA